MTRESQRLAGLLLVVHGGVTLLTMLIRDPAYMANPIRRNLWRAGQAHAGGLLVLALVALRYVDDANLSDVFKQVARSFVPLAAILMPAGFFLSILSQTATAPNGLIVLTYVGAVVLAIGALTLGVGLLRSDR